MQQQISPFPAPCYSAKLGAGSSQAQSCVAERLRFPRPRFATRCPDPAARAAPLTAASRRAAELQE